MTRSRGEVVGRMPESRESVMVVIEANEHGATVWCDPEISDLVRALNAGGVRTIASCSGHGYRPGNIILADGRELFIANSFDEARAVDRAFPVDINGESPPDAKARKSLGVGG